MITNQNAKVSMISTDGGVKWIPTYLKDKMEKEGWKVVIDPKRDYYMELDQTLKNPLVNNTQENGELDIEII